MHHLSEILSSLAGLVFFYGAFFLSTSKHGTRRMRFAYAGSMGAVFALKLLMDFAKVEPTLNFALFTLLCQALGLLGCVRVLIDATRDRGATAPADVPPTPHG